MIVLVLMVAGLSYLGEKLQTQNNYSYKELEQDLENHQVSEAVIHQNQQTPTGQLIVVLTNGRNKDMYIDDVKEVRQMLENANVSYQMTDVPKESKLLSVGVPIASLGVMVILLFMLMGRNAGSSGGGSKMMNFGKSRAQMTTTSGKRFTFRDVAGLQEEKEDLKEIVDFLKSPDKYNKVGARIPKGVLLVGPPGTGKTLMAKAVAGEAGVPFFSISGSDFVEMFVGVGASRVRDLFEEGKRHSPCIIFIDEIDAVARRRGTGMGGGHDEREQTLNQLLVEMDGFGVNEGIIVMAATNRVDILDPAILRPGRFDRTIAVGAPDVRGREEILKVHAKGKPLGDDVDLAQIAQTTAGFTGAELENLLNEAAILAAKEDRQFLCQKDIQKAFIKVGIGTEKHSRVISEKEKKITAYHEAGHAILFHVLEKMDPVYTISIIPTGAGAAGYTMPLPNRDEMFNTRGKMLENIQVCLGGRIAEELIFDDITTGASEDIRRATSIAKAMVTKYGMSANMGMVTYGDDQDEVFIGRDLAHSRGFSETTAAAIDREVKEIIDDCYVKAKASIQEHSYVLEHCAQLLLEKEKIGRAEFEELFEEEKNTAASGEIVQNSEDEK
ncbi:ATP-dependent metallopeptidase FtsH/Yme1/Tma family protein [Blautia faecicola]|uniref:ATP-dependent zinc metalloprotease FtsH n=1 Tax=Blautia faecicola TaxID=2509240 RepID=A0A4Q1RLN8_9FIRM|nr:ATP-dependent metallopeptidase FtsH/Yme1/Tma family protein [Blautia faecicola]